MTYAELDYIAAKVAPMVKVMLGNGSRGVDSFPVVQDLDGIKTLPAWRIMGGVPEVVTVLASALKGADGTAPNITLRLEMLPSGSGASVVRAGTEAAPEYTFKMPKGDNGDTPMLMTSAMGIGWKYPAEPADAFRLLVPYEDVKLKFSDLHPEDIAALQAPAIEAANVALDAAAKALDAANHPTIIGADHYVYVWDATTGEYNKTNIYTKGEGFKVRRTYLSVAAMDADYGNPEIKEGDFVLINTEDVENPENARLYIKGPVRYDFLVDMSGAVGFTGKTPQITIGSILTGDQAAASLSEDGFDDDGNPCYKLNMVFTRGEKGDTGRAVEPVIETVTLAAAGWTEAADGFEYRIPDANIVLTRKTIVRILVQDNSLVAAQDAGMRRELRYEPGAIVLTAKQRPYADIDVVYELLFGNVASADVECVPKANQLATARKINGVPFDGTADITIEDAARPKVIIAASEAAALVASANDPVNLYIWE